MKTDKKQRVIAVCGLKNSGKTTLIERMLRELSSRGLKTAVIKHDGHDFTCDIPGTDSDRFMRAGAAGAAVYSASQMFVRKTFAGEPGRTEGPDSSADHGMRLLQFFPEADVVIIEGMKNSPVRKIEVVRSGIGTAPVSNPEGRVLVVTDIPEAERGFSEPAAGFDELERILEIVLDGWTAEAETEGGGKPSCCAVILAGGKSSRMGRDKASLMLGEKTFLERIAAELDACGFEEKYVSLGSGSISEAAEAGIRIPSGWTVIRDVFPDCGPLGGIHAALSSCRAEWALFVSCDTPLYRREFAEFMISKIPGTQLLVPVTPDGRWHLTCALWRKSLLPEAEAQLISGDYRLRGVCFKDGELSPGTVLVHLEGEQAAFAEMLGNINTEEDYRQMVVKNCRGS